jgi:putative CRISPR-associated protein (TIGR02619 family)
MNKPCLILSPAGTSLLTNCAESGEERKVLVNVANNKKDEITNGELEIINCCAMRAATKLADGNDDVCKAASAEINGLLSYCNQHCGAGYGQLIFIQTDTYLGDVVMDLLRTYLNKRLPDFPVDVWKPASLSTRTKAGFLAGINEVVKLCEENLPDWSGNYHVVFNLTGGFKSVQGYLNTLGMLYADEIVYLFENSAELLRIPKLPVSLNIPGFDNSGNILDIEKYVPLLALADKNYLPIDKMKIENELPELFFEMIDENNAVLTPWGTAVWRRIRKDMAAKRLYELPYLEYSERFKKDFQNFSQDKNNKAELLDALIILSSELLINDGNHDCLRNIRGINYTPLKKSKIYDHIRINDGDRVSCEKKANGKIELRHWGLHDDVNDNP